MVLPAANAVAVLAATGVITALSAAIISLVVTMSTDRMQRRLGSTVHTIELDLPSAPELDGLRWNVLYVRDGDDAITHELSERERWFARLRNEILPFADSRGTATRKTATLRFYRPLGVQFKCFVDVGEPRRRGVGAASAQRYQLRGDTS